MEQKSPSSLPDIRVVTPLEDIVQYLGLGWQETDWCAKGFSCVKQQWVASLAFHKVRGL